MKISLTLLAVLLGAAPLAAQETPAPRPTPRANRAPVTARDIGDYDTTLKTLRDAQTQAIEQAKQMLEENEEPRERAAIETAIKEMERSQALLAEAQNSPEKLSTALAAQQAAYQALLKMIPREHRVTRSRRNSGGGGGGNQANQRQLDQLDMKDEANRYETERQAGAPQTPQQREQTQMADLLKQLAQRQQDVNERLKELQAALQAARTEAEREELQRQLKRLRDEERQMLADVDELRQQMERSPNAGSLAEAREQLEQTRSDIQRAAEKMERNSPSQALAAGTRAQQNMQNLREDLRRSASSQFAEQMRELRNEARELAREQEEIARQMDAMQNARRQSLDNSVERQRLAEQMMQQQSALTNLLGGIREVTEQSENIEPLLSRQLYDTLRRTDQMRTDNLLQMGAQLAQRGFLPQAGEAERVARTNIYELRRNIERAAESVLGSEAEALRYAQRQLDDLTRQLERELGGNGTNAGLASTGNMDSGTNSLTRSGGRLSEQNADGTNRLTSAGGRSSSESQNRENRSQPGPNENAEGSQNSQNGSRGQQASAENQNGPSGQNGESAQRGQGEGNQQNEPAPNSDSGHGSGSGQNQSEQANAEGRNAGQQGQGNGRGGDGSERERLRRFAEQLGQGGGAGGNRGGPITGGGYADWSDRLRDVEQVLEPADLRNELAGVRERVSVLRSEFRQRGRAPDPQKLQDEILTPLAQVRVWLQQELARKENAATLVPLDRDPVPENFSELVRQYYEKLGSAQ